MLSTLVLAGCASAEHAPHARASHAGAPHAHAGTSGPASAEMAALEPMIGDWEGLAEFVEPSPEAMQKMMAEMNPDLEGEMPTSFKGGNTTRWVLGGHSLRTESWHEEAPGVFIRYHEYITWRPAVGKYRTHYFADNGDFGEGWMTRDAAKGTFSFEAEGTSGGQPSTGRGTLSFPDPDTIEWTW
jgi:hypothetical protein